MSNKSSANGDCLSTNVVCLSKANKKKSLSSFQENEGTFWTENPSVLLTSFSIFPSPSMTREEGLNAITRLVLLGTILLFLFSTKRYAIPFFVAGIFLVLFARNGLSSTTTTVNSGIKEGFTPIVGRNPRQDATPIMTPRATDPNVWNTESRSLTTMNSRVMNEIPEEAIINPRTSRFQSMRYDPEHHENSQEGSYNKENKRNSNKSLSFTYLDDEDNDYDDTTPFLSRTRGSTVSNDWSNSRGSFNRIGMNRPSPGTENGDRFELKGIENFATFDDGERYSINPRSLTHRDPRSPYRQREHSEYHGCKRKDEVTTTGLNSYGQRENYRHMPQERRIFLNTVQPNIYSYAERTENITSDGGIIPTTPVDDSVTRTEGVDGKIYYSRNSPELIRDNDQSRPYLQRGPWSERMSEFEAAPSINLYDVYDPRYTGYGDGSRAYEDLNGNIKYYYSDIDAYKKPNYTIRSKVDHITYKDPQGKEYPEYWRTPIEDVREEVENDFTASTLFFRENLSESQMRKMNARNYQMRMMPFRRDSHPHYST